MPEGSAVKVLAGPQNSFYKLSYNGREGWGHGNYLKAESGGGGGGGGAYPSGIKWSAASSSNYAGGRQGSAIKWVIIHNMEGRYEGAISWFKNPAAQVSAHYCIRSSDGDITQMVREQDTGWHAGNGTYNRGSIGIEHEGWLSDPGRWYTDVMYRRSAQLTAAISKRYGIPKDRSRIIAHAEVPPPNTHTDPGPGWDWNKYMSLVRSF
jgi:N-acetyl-anhydromuramyl-L-alanine amidase AmpD